MWIHAAVRAMTYLGLGAEITFSTHLPRLNIQHDFIVRKGSRYLLAIMNEMSEGTERRRLKSTG